MASLGRLLTSIALLLATVLAVPALGQEGDLSVRIRETRLEPDGATRLVVSVTGPAADGVILEPDALTVEEAGGLIAGVTVRPLLEDAGSALAVMLVIDVSGSTAGEPIEAARAAAKDLVAEFTTAGGMVGLVAFGQTAQVVTPITDDAGELVRAIDGLVADGETALYDGVALAADTIAGFDGLRNLIVFSDGADTVSAVTIEEAIATAAAAESPATTVALATDALDPEALTSVASGTGGRLIEAVDSASLAAAFDAAAEVVASQYVITYSATPAESSDLDLVVSASVGTVSAQDRITVANPRRVVSEGPAPARIPEPIVPTEPWVLWTGVGAAFLALLLLLGTLFLTLRSEEEGRRLRRSIGAHTGAQRARPRELDAASLSRRAGELVEHLPLSAAFTSGLQKRIDRAAWPLRASEFVALQLAAGIGAAALAWAVTGKLLFVPVGLLVGGFAPRAVLDRRVASRSAAFMEQLPDTLGLLAGSLKAGYGLVQAVDTVVREAAAPTSEEFARVLTETRLGMPLSEALEGMAERLESEDFGWVVMAINIQAQVGGNLANLLETVADTLRGRDQVRRQVRTLSAEGKLSAYVLIGLVPAMGLYMFSINPTYMALLWTTSMGRMMLLIGGSLMVGGILGIKKVISIDV